MNFTAYPRHWLRLHLIARRGFLYVSLYLGWQYRFRRFHLQVGA